MNPLHQDYPYWVDVADDPATVATAMLFLDDSTLDNGCLRVVPGKSHERRVGPAHRRQSVPRQRDRRDRVPRRRVRTDRVCGGNRRDVRLVPGAPLRTRTDLIGNDARCCSATSRPAVRTCSTRCASSLPTAARSPAYDPRDGAWQECGSAVGASDHDHRRRACRRRVARDRLARAERHRDRFAGASPARARTPPRDSAICRPARRARLRRQRSQVWAAIIADIENPFFTSVVRGIEDVARAEDHRLVLCNSDEDLATEAAYIDVVVAERMAGVVISVASARESTLAPLLARGIPVVAVDRRPARRARRLRRRRQPQWRGGRDGAPRRARCDAHRVHHRPEPGRHRERTVARLSGRARRRRVAAGPLAGSARRLQGGGRLSGRPLAAREFVTTGCALRGEPSDDRRCVARRCAISAGASPTTSRSSASTIRRSPTLVSPQLTVVTQPAYEIGRAAAALLATAGERRAPEHVVCSPTLVVRGELAPPAPRVRAGRCC